MIELKKYWMLMLALAMMCGGCEKVIELDLDTAEPLVVIDASVTDQMEPQVVKISTTYKVSDQTRFNALSKAQVVLTPSVGLKVIFSESTSSPGVYISRNYQGRPGRTYTLDVIVDGKTYSATSTMPQLVPLDSVTFKQFTAFGESNTFLAMNYTDPASVQNQYRYVLKVKDKIEQTEITEDRFSNGNKTSDIVYYELQDLPADTQLDIDFQCIDRNVFKYFYAISQISGNGGPPVAPANPVSNFNNGALGIFSAHTSTRRNIVLK
jgi:hypothetical protein